MPFTAAELEEMRRADAEIEANFCLTRDELVASRLWDRAAKLEALPPEKRRMAAAKKAYREANREKVAAAQRWIKDLRLECGYTQADLARLCGMSQPLVSMLELGMMSIDRCKCADKLREILTQR